MSNTNTNTPTTSESVTVAAVQTGTVEHIDPQLVQFEDNVRETVGLDKGFLASVKAEGILLPVLARRDEDGIVWVRDGQRRTLAAREAGLATIPAYFGTVSESKTARITQQLVTNDRRTGISAGERVNAFHQLALEGMTATAIARKTGEKKATVEASITVAQSPHAADAISTGQITLDAALILTEFEDDPDAIADLTTIAFEDPDMLTHAAARVRATRERRTRVTEKVDQLTADGIRCVTDTDENTGTRLSSLTDSTEATDEGTRAPLDPDAHTGCEGHAVLVEARWSDDVAVIPVCLDPEANGHQPRYSTPTYSSGPQTGPMTEEQKAERRTVIENNRAWDAAETVRIDWLTTLLSRKTLPKDAALFVAHGLTVHRGVTGTAITNGNQIAARILGIDSEGRWGTDRLAQYTLSTPTKAGHVALAVILGGLEASTRRNTWRDSRPITAAAYLTRLSEWGYTLSDVEQIVTNAGTPATADNTTTENQ